MQPGRWNTLIFRRVPLFALSESTVVKVRAYRADTNCGSGASLHEGQGLLGNVLPATTFGWARFLYRSSKDFS